MDLQSFANLKPKPGRRIWNRYSLLLSEDTKCVKHLHMIGYCNQTRLSYS